VPELLQRASDADAAGVAKRDTQFGINAGSPVFLLDDPDGNTYCMKSASLITDPDQTYDSLADLGGRLKPPPGWRLQTQVLDKDLILTPDHRSMTASKDPVASYEAVHGLTRLTGPFRTASHRGKWQPGATGPDVSVASGVPPDPAFPGSLLGPVSRGAAPQPPPLSLEVRPPLGPVVRIVHGPMRQEIRDAHG
jgi:hypothetical protein